jgi:hypothetical protein
LVVVLGQNSVAMVGGMHNDFVFVVVVMVRADEKVNFE